MASSNAKKKQFSLQTWWKHCILNRRTGASYGEHGLRDLGSIPLSFTGFNLIIFKCSISKTENCIDMKCMEMLVSLGKV